MEGCQQNAKNYSEIDKRGRDEQNGNGNYGITVDNRLTQEKSLEKGVNDQNLQSVGYWSDKVAEFRHFEVGQ
ncbi:hypothetical protein CAEBREN_01007 [Caenorhabditis brenneri]|uniref:Uncharacterized protein n=1 Tax=Caenorhabditis brenneri TaxID=135651 RepID=G0ML43_CAEBE|nr:hypothetical protein CAEBREN_01007 [Caenorhabditis brenneri]